MITTIKQQGRDDIIVDHSELRGRVVIGVLYKTSNRSINKQWWVNLWHNYGDKRLGLRLIRRVYA